MGFGQGLSGLKAASQNLDVIGNNIANSATVGFKASTIAFADVYATSRVGLGVQVASVDQRFTTGNLSITGNQFDMAIDGDKGLFRLIDKNGQTVYSRNGQFHADKNHNIVNAQGQQLTGYRATADGKITGELMPIKVPVGNVDPKATTEATVRANFDSREDVISTNSALIDAYGEINLVNTDTPPIADADGVYQYRFNTEGDVVWVGAEPPAGEYTAGGVSVTVSPDPDVKIPRTTFENIEHEDNTLPPPAIQGEVVFDPTRTENHSHSLPMTVYDSLGNPHQLTQYFVKTAATENSSEWEVYYKTEGNLEVSPASQKLTFNKAGVLTNPAPGAMVPVTISGIGLGNPDANPATPNTSPANELVVNINYTGSTQFGGAFTPSFTQNGYSTGEYSSMEIASNGDILANYTNGETKIMGAIALADFNNLNGLRPIGGNAWIETSASGPALLGRPGANGLATLRGQAVEESNVDMSEELVNMIIAQRTYQANAQTIKTQDQILQTLITLR